MNKFVVFITLPFATNTLSAPSPLRSLPALKHEHIRDEFGQYALRYVTAEGTVVSENGHLVASPDGKGHVMIMEGEVKYVGDDGKTYVTKYTSGLDGVKIEGDHLPIAPIIPPADSSAAPLDTTIPSIDARTTPAVTLPDAPAVLPMISTVAA